MSSVTLYSSRNLFQRIFICCDIFTDVFKFDPDYLEAERKYKALCTEILGSDGEVTVPMPVTKTIRIRMMVAIPTKTKMKSQVTAFNLRPAFMTLELR